MGTYKLLTPGPLTTTKTVKEEMLVDHCTWDKEYMEITQDIRARLLKVAGVSDTEYTTILMQGSGTFGVESVISSVISDTDELLILANGAYGERIGDIAKANKINYKMIKAAFNERPSVEEAEVMLKNNPSITHIAMVHCETTTGILNDLKPFSELAQKYGKVFIVDAMSSFGGIEIDVAGLKIDFLISSANKCIQGTPGFSFIIAKLDKLEASRGNARTLSLDLHDQYDGMHEGKWRFTSPTHIVLAFLQALKELDAEGGVKARQARYQGNMDLVRKNFTEIGIKPYLPAEVQSPIIATFEYPKENFSFLDMYNFIKERGFAIYPGKLMGLDTFRIGVIGEIYPEDIEKLSAVMAEYFAQ